MSKFPLKPLLDLSQLRLDEATRRLGELITGEQQAEQRLQMLVEYRAEYHTRFLEAARNGLGRDSWQNYQSFLGRLDAAIDQAGTMAEASKQRTAEGKEEWIAKRGRVKAFDTLEQRHRSRLDQAELRREQKALDEHSSRRASQKEIE
ncbi:MAG: flagellar export protein FliJ [Gammaproteobacteria bacterium]|nr:flagellar export protein FliJ [Gammaproteobacteria bacterium]MBU1646188.1 flagellar export protein FliJ [Gammaproteobacteria bacterium]MBU1972250.1 flagellar export protein FliJ [Gammaproteobacteria bacterium]